MQEDRARQLERMGAKIREDLAAIGCTVATGPRTPAAGQPLELTWYATLAGPDIPAVTEYGETEGDAICWAHAELRTAVLHPQLRPRYRTGS